MTKRPKYYHFRFTYPSTFQRGGNVEDHSIHQESPRIKTNGSPFVSFDPRTGTLVSEYVGSWTHGLLGGWCHTYLLSGSINFLVHDVSTLLPVDWRRRELTSEWVSDVQTIWMSKSWKELSCNRRILEDLSVLFRTSCMNFLQTGLMSLLRVAENIITCFSWGVARKISWTSLLISGSN